MSETTVERVECPGCRRRYRWTLQVAGRKIKCQNCGTVMRVGATGGVAALVRGNGAGTSLLPAQPVVVSADPKVTGEYELVDADRAAAPAAPPSGSTKCPSCNQEMAAAAVVCVKCGFNRREKKKLVTAVNQESETAPADKPRPMKPHLTGEAAHALTIAEERRLRDERMADDIERHHRIVDLYAPLILIGIGATLLLLNIVVMAPLTYASAFVGPIQIMAGYGIIAAVRFAIQFPLMLASIFLLAKLFGTGYGTLGSGLLKLAAVALMMGGVDDAMATGLDWLTGGFGGIGWMLRNSIVFCTFFALCHWLFEMEGTECLVLYAVLILAPILLLLVIAPLILY